MATCKIKHKIFANVLFYASPGHHTMIDLGDCIKGPASNESTFHFQPMHHDTEPTYSQRHCFGWGLETS